MATTTDVLFIGLAIVALWVRAPTPPAADDLFIDAPPVSKQCMERSVR